MPQDNTKPSTYRMVGIVVSVSLHVLFLGLLLVSCLGNDKPQPLLKEISMKGTWEAIPVTPVSAKPEPAAKPDSPAPPEPKPQPPEPKPQPPEPKPEPPKPSKPEPAPKKAAPPKKEAPKPKTAEKPKTAAPPKKSKADEISDILKNAPKTKTTPQKSNSSKNTTAEVTKQLDRLANKGPSVSSTQRGNPNGLVGEQLSAYDKYLVGCLEPILQAYWDQLGPDRLNGAPKPVQITLIIGPSGNITSVFISGNSDNAQMNDSAKKLNNKMLNKRLDSFASVGLKSKQPLTFIVNLEYRQGTR